MTLQELYQEIEGDYDQAIRVLRIEKLIDKHIRKFPTNGVADSLLKAGETMDAQGLFEAAHALKGICGNLGLVRIAALADQITEEFRPGNTRRKTDDEVKDLLQQTADLCSHTSAGIARYAEG